MQPSTPIAALVLAPQLAPPADRASEGQVGPSAGGVGGIQGREQGAVNAERMEPRVGWVSASVPVLPPVPMFRAPSMSPPSIAPEHDMAPEHGIHRGRRL